MANEDISLEKGTGTIHRIVAKENGAEVGFLEIDLLETKVVARHTEVFPAGEGKGWGKKLFEKLIELVRSEKKKLVPLCPFVLSRLKKNPEEYADVYP